MNPGKKSLFVLLLLILILAAISAVNTLFPIGGDLAATMTASQMPASKPVMALAVGGVVLVAYGLLAVLGRWLARSLGIPDLFDPSVNNRQRFLIPLIAGAILGAILIVLDVVFARINGIGKLDHPGFPFSILASLSAGIGEEAIFRLFFISLWTWIVSKLILRGRGFDAVFWVVTAVSALAFSASHLPALMYLLNVTDYARIPPVLLVEIFLMNGAISVLAPYLMKKYGYLAAAGSHFWADIVWHTIWGFFG